MAHLCLPYIRHCYVLICYCTSTYTSEEDDAHTMNSCTAVDIKSLADMLHTVAVYVTDCTHTSIVAVPGLDF